MDFANKRILAPMVRVGTLPMRLLCLEYGADYVYSEEIIDFKMVKCKRVVNNSLGTIDYMSPDEQYPIFQTCSKEKDAVIFQMGTCNANRALEVAKIVEKDVAGIDINMGCPKAFSIQGGMGAALLTQPEKIEEILITLVRGVGIPITCKIRILPDLEDTVSLVKRIEKCGVAAIAIHGRTKQERPQHSNHNDVIKYISQAVSIPVIANGGSKEITCINDIIRFKSETGADSVMVARVAMLNPSIFRPKGILCIEDVIEAYLKLCCQYDSNPGPVKYTLQLFLQYALHTTERGLRLLEAKTLREIVKIWHLDDYYLMQREHQKDRLMRANRLRTNDEQEKTDLTDEMFSDDVIQFPVSFVRNHYADNNDMPRMILHHYAVRHALDTPLYITKASGKHFICIVVFGGQKFASSLRGKNKKHAEQSSALAALIVLNLTHNLPNLALENLPRDEIDLLKDLQRKCETLIN